MMVAITSCDEHREFPDTAMKTCDILCTDGKVVRYEDMKSQGKQPIAVVFHINQNNETQGTGYAVYLWDIAPEAYSDSVGVKHNTSANITAFDGNMNTHSMYSSGVSPAATAVFDMWQYGQSAYIPSVAEIRLLYGAKNTVNDYIKKCGGDVISDDPDECWYWTSTEVKDMESAKAWLFSLLLEHFKKHLKNNHIKYAQSSLYTIRVYNNLSKKWKKPKNFKLPIRYFARSSMCRYSWNFSSMPLTRNCSTTGAA